MRLVGLESGNVSPPVSFLRWRRREQAERWIAEQRLSDLTEWRVTHLSYLLVPRNADRPYHCPKCHQAIRRGRRWRRARFLRCDDCLVAWWPR